MCDTYIYAKMEQGEEYIKLSHPIHLNYKAEISLISHDFHNEIDPYEGLRFHETLLLLMADTLKTDDVLNEILKTNYINDIRITYVDGRYIMHVQEPYVLFLSSELASELGMPERVKGEVVGSERNSAYGSTYIPQEGLIYVYKDIDPIPSKQCVSLYSNNVEECHVGDKMEKVLTVLSNSSSLTSQVYKSLVHSSQVSHLHLRLVGEDKRIIHLKRPINFTFHIRPCQ